ncbi:MAG: hypothetical protein ACE5I4_09835 [Thermoplasmata archaeon]
MPVRGRGALLVIRIAAIGAVLAFIALALTTIALVLPGNLEILPPELNASSARFQDGRVYLDTTLGIGNNGYHDITDLSLFVQASVGGVQISDYRTPPVTAPVGMRTFIDVSVPMDLVPLVATGALIFRPADVNFTLGVAGTTTRSFIDFGAAFTFQQSVDPLIQQAWLDLRNGTLAVNGTAYLWAMPYTVETASFLQGNATARITILNATGGLVGNATEVVPLGRLVNGNATFQVSAAVGLDLATRAQDLTVRLELTLPGGLTVANDTVVAWDPGGG